MPKFFFEVQICGQMEGNIVLVTTRSTLKCLQLYALYVIVNLSSLRKIKKKFLRYG